jgi:hypothetical protein
MSKTKQVLALTTEADSKKNTYNYIGGPPCLNQEEEYPICAHCENPLTHIATLDLNSIPFSGMMQTDGMLRILACYNRPECNCFVETKEVYIKIMQNGDGQFDFFENNEVNELRRQIFTEQTIMPLEDVKTCYIQRKADVSYLSIDLSFYRMLFNRNGKVYQLESLLLEDTSEGVSFKRTMLKNITGKTITPVKNDLTVPVVNNENTESLGKSPKPAKSIKTKKSPKPDKKVKTEKPAKSPRLFSFETKQNKTEAPPKTSDPVVAEEAEENTEIVTGNPSPAGTFRFKKLTHDKSNVSSKPKFNSKPKPKPKPNPELESEWNESPAAIEKKKKTLKRTLKREKIVTSP